MNRIRGFFRQHTRSSIPVDVPSLDEINTIAYIIDHTSWAQGADSYELETSEYQYYQNVLEHVRSSLDMHIVYRDNGWAAVSDELQRINPDVVVEWHFNSFNGSAQGYEALTLDGRPSVLSDIFLDTMRNEFPDRVERGVKYPHRGKYNLHIASGATPHCVLVEPFFGDNTNDVIYPSDMIRFIRLFTENLRKHRG